LNILGLVIDAFLHLLSIKIWIVIKKYSGKMECQWESRFHGYRSGV
jgi:hypothetical protein